MEEPRILLTFAAYDLWRNDET